MLDRKRERRIDTGGGVLHVTEQGRGAPVLLLHGFAGSARAMQPLASALAREFRVIAPDLIGHGRSDAPREAAAYGWDAVTHGLTRLLDALDVQEAHLLGFSLGGRIALQVAARHSGRVRAVAAIGSRCAWRDDAERAARRARDHALADRIDALGFAAAFAARGGVDAVDAPDAAHGEGMAGTDAREAALRAAAPRGGAHGLALVLRHLGAADQPDLRASLASGALPVLLIAGGADSGPLASARDLAATLPHARLLEIPGATHRAHLTHPVQVARAATDFFHASDAQRAGRATTHAAGASCGSGETSW